jgi:asparagine synthase (glutamine-hydrolysing)
MCGIYGVLFFPGSDQHEDAILDRMASRSLHRGPDEEGRYRGQNVLLGMRRLAIIDVAGGQQPISNEDNTLWIVCNGEIYNFRELRQALTSRGHVFRTGSDSEAVLHLYEEYGDEFVQHLDGMYGFALWDEKRQRLLIGRDRLGIKPIYYYVDGSRLIFASEAKAILAVPGVRTNIDSAALGEYLALGYVPAPHSIFASIRKLPPASLLICGEGECRVHRYWTLPEGVDDSMSESDWAEAVLAYLERAVVSQMVSDVPLGAFLSGGIDSSAVVGLMARHSDQPVKTYSIGFDESAAGEYYNELPYARQISKLFATKHKEIVVRPDVAKLLPRLVWHMDEPIADSAFLTTYLVAQFAREDVTVILCGVGGDELFGGYRRYLGEYYGEYYNCLPAWLRRRLIAPAARLLPSDRHAPLLNFLRYVRTFVLANDLPFEERYRAYVQVFSPAQRARLLSDHRGSRHSALLEAFSRARTGDALRRIFEVDLATQLPDDLLLLTDRMTMATSLECRVPWLDHRLVELAGRMPSRYKVRGRELKYILKRALSNLLPADILYRQKRGFGAPFGAWLKRELRPLLSCLLSRESVQRRGLLNWEAVRETAALHQDGREDFTDHLMALLNLEIWCRLYLDGRSPEDLALEIGAKSSN